MSLTDDQIEAKNFQKFYNAILPYLNGAAHAGFTPIGTVISVMGTTAPLNYLACDGTVYNISDYSELAAYFNTQFGSSNFFGGNGTTTFAVPDLRGEFLRGTGTNSHANQGSGANVGVHQDGTEHIKVYSRPEGGIEIYTTSESYVQSLKDDYDSSSTGSGNYKRLIIGQKSDTSGGIPYYTSRPTNTSVLYCIASKNIFMDAGSNYSTEEQVVGTWIDGKPLYQKTFMCTSNVAISQNTWTAINNAFSEMTTGFVSAIDSIISSQASVLKDCFYGNFIVYPNYPSAGQLGIYLSGVYTTFTAGSGFITLQYTKTTD